MILVIFGISVSKAIGLYQKIKYPSREMGNAMTTTLINSDLKKLSSAFILIASLTAWI
jgi:hypothetical protein